jgi:filamentous hemagglutinin
VPALNLWIGSSGGLWSSAGNWGLGTTPSSSDELYFGTITSGGITGTNTSSVDDMATATVSSVTADSTYTSTITVNAGKSIVSGSAFTANGPLTMLAGSSITAQSQDVITNGLLTMSAAAITASGGTVYLNGGATVNYGTLSGISTITADDLYQGSALTVSTSTGGGGLTPAVTLNIVGDYTPITGTLTTVSGSTINVTSSTQISMEGELDLINSTFSTTNGLKVDGTLKTFNSADTIGGNLENNGSIIWASAAPFTTLSVTGNYTQDVGGQLSMRIQGGGGVNDNLTVNGSASLDGTLNVSLTGGVLAALNNFSLIACAASSMSGNFSTFNLPTPAVAWTNTIVTGAVDTYNLTD